LRRDTGRPWSVRDEIAKWTHGDDWRTWVAHTVIALFLTVIFGWKIAIGFYFLRECDQVFYMVVDKVKLHPFDHFMDVAVPAAVVIPTVWLIDHLVMEWW
jgi:hypothetical protein